MNFGATTTKPSLPTFFFLSTNLLLCNSPDSDLSILTPIDPLSLTCTGSAGSEVDERGTGLISRVISAPFKRHRKHVGKTNDGAQRWPVGVVGRGRARAVLLARGVNLQGNCSRIFLISCHMKRSFLFRLGRSCLGCQGRRLVLMVSIIHTYHRYFELSLCCEIVRELCILLSESETVLMLSRKYYVTSSMIFYSNLCCSLCYFLHLVTESTLRNLEHPHTSRLFSDVNWKTLRRTRKSAKEVLVLEPYISTETP
jgi:hypothetical protein